MHHPPDLNLASSYIPACLCLLKCTVTFVLFIFSPVRGWIGLISILITDRVLWNQSAHSTILDVNAVCVSLAGGMMVVHARSDGIKTLAHFGITGAWIMLSSLQILGVTRLHRAYEVLFAAFSVSVLSCLFQTQERTELLALRSFVYVIANATLPYLGVMLQQPDIDTYINACRTLLILLGEPETASAWVVVYILCIGYQVRKTSSSSCVLSSNSGRKGYAQQQHLVKYTPYPDPYFQPNEDDFADDSPPPPPAHIIDTNHCGEVYAKQSTVQSSTAQSAGASSSSEEAALLREALANRKGHRDA